MVKKIILKLAFLTELKDETKILMSQQLLITQGTIHLPKQ